VQRQQASESPLVAPTSPPVPPPPPPPPESLTNSPSAVPPVTQKSPGLAALASFLFAGLGQVYNGNFLKGLGIFFGALIGSLFFLIPGIIVFVYGIYDAYKTAKRMNAGEIPFREHNWLHIILFLVIVVVVIIIVVMILFALMLAFEESFYPDIYGYY